VKQEEVEKYDIEKNTARSKFSGKKYRSTTKGNKQ